MTSSKTTKSKTTSEKIKTSSFSVYPMPQATVMSVFLEKDSFGLNPDYQREGDVWNVAKKQLLIDSLINRYDIPKLYVHKYHKEMTSAVAVVDGKQRLSTMWEFLKNEFPLADDFVYLQDTSISISGLTYQEIAKKYPIIAAKFAGTQLPIMVIDTEELELIEELFSRLNEAVPLNASEKRNAFGGSLPPVIREIVSKNKFFNKNLPFSNKRYRHFDLACKFLYLSDTEQLVDIKKIKLDLFVKKYHSHPNQKRVIEFSTHTKSVLGAISKVFIPSDKLLKSVGVVVPIYWLFSKALDANLVENLSRIDFENFEKEREKNRTLAQANKKADYLFLRFDELNSTVNDAYAIQFKYSLMAKTILPQLLDHDPSIKQALKLSQ